MTVTLSPGSTSTVLPRPAPTSGVASLRTINPKLVADQDQLRNDQIGRASKSTIAADEARVHSDQNSTAPSSAARPSVTTRQGTGFDAYA